MQEALRLIRNMKSRKSLKFFFIGIFMLQFFISFAHQPNQSYIYFNIYSDRVDGTIELAIEDINRALGTKIEDSNYFKKPNAEIEKAALPEEWKKYIPQIKSYLQNRIQISQSGANLNIDYVDYEILPLSKRVYILCHYKLGLEKPIPNDLDINYNVLFDKDDTHRGLAIIGYNWKAGVINNESMSSLIFSPNSQSQTLAIDRVSVWQGFFALVKLGMWHIYIGIDHIFFLLALMLPAVIRKRNMDNRNDIVGVEKFSSAIWYILKIVTLFTIAHSITLSLAALGYINLESWLVESIIAFSIGLAALHNIYPIFHNSEKLIAFLFGLFHGMGFASVLGEKGIEGEYLALSLFGFNIGVEVGQILIICAIFPILFLLRKKSAYKNILLYGSIFLIIASLYWFVERFFDVNFLLDDYIGKAINKIFKIIGLK